MTNNIAITTRRINPRAVSFSEFSEIVFIPRDEDCHLEKSKKWYSSNDRHRFYQTLTNDARQASQEIQGLSAGEIMSPEQLYNCLGIEAFLQRGAAVRAQRSRRAHMSAVLTEQYRQKHKGICDPERLSIVSQKVSHGMKERAWKLAVGYASISIIEG